MAATRSRPAAVGSSATRTSCSSRPREVLRMDGPNVLPRGRRSAAAHDPHRSRLGNTRLRDAGVDLAHELVGRFEPDSVFGYCDLGPDGAAIDQAGLLQGAAGVVLALLAAATPEPPRWDRVFLELHLVVDRTVAVLTGVLRASANIRCIRIVDLEGRDRFDLELVWVAPLIFRLAHRRSFLEAGTDTACTDRCNGEYGHAGMPPTSQSLTCGWLRSTISRTSGRSDSEATFAPTGFFALRTPLLPFGELLDWVGGERSGAGAGDRRRSRATASCCARLRRIRRAPRGAGGDLRLVARRSRR